MSFSGCDSYGFPIYQRSFLRSSLLQGHGVSRMLMGAPLVHAPLSSTGRGSTEGKVA